MSALSAKKPAPGFSKHRALIGKPSPKRWGGRRLRVHESCRLAGDEVLGYSAPSGEIACSRCSEPITETATVVQVFPPGRSQSLSGAAL
jgi:hypothetical protein